MLSPSPVQLELFSTPKAVEYKAVKRLSPDVDLSDFLKRPVIDMMKSGVQSATEICESLVRDHGAAEESFSTGKRQIYVPVCIFLDSLVTEGRAELISKSNQDRIYNYCEG